MRSWQHRGLSPERLALILRYADPTGRYRIGLRLAQPCP